MPTAPQRESASRLGHSHPGEVTTAGPNRVAGAPLRLLLRRRSAVLPLATRLVAVTVVGSPLLGPDLIQLVQLTLEVGLQTSAVVTLKDPQLVDLLLQQGTFVTEGLKHLGPLLLCLGDHSGGTLARLGDHLLVLRRGLGNQLLVPGSSLGDELIVLGLTGRPKLMILCCGLTNDLVMA